MVFRDVFNKTLESVNNGMLQNTPLDIPKAVLEQLNEQTGGGFLLFYVNGHGETSYIPYTDSQALLRALISYAQDITSGIRMAQQEDIVSFFIGDDHNEGDS